jgi:hypothetical protein
MITYKLLYQGQLGNSVATLATVGAGKTWQAGLFKAVNNDSSARTFGLCQNGTVAANRITAPAISIPAGGEWEWAPEKPVCLAAADTLAGGASVATQVTLSVWGVEIS